MTVEKMSLPKKPSVMASEQNTPSSPSPTTSDSQAKSQDSPEMLATPTTPTADSNQTSVTYARKKEPRIFKIIVIGDSNVGKTCLTYRFCEGRFPTKVEATIGVDFREKTVEIAEDVLKLQLWDTAGQERFRKSMVPHYYRNVHAVVYVYDITKRSTFDSLDNWLSEYSRHSLNENVPRILVGNKCDLVSLVQVSTNEAQRFADKYNMPLFETSAKDEGKTDHVDSIFMTVAHKLKEARPMMGSRYGSMSQDKPNTRPHNIQYTTIGQESKETCAC